MKKAAKPLNQGPSWTISDLKEYEKVIDEIAVEEFGLETFPFQWELITAEQMIDAYSSIGLPISYSHWRYGKYHTQQSNSYKQGKSGLAYEMIINCLKKDTIIYTENDGIKEIYDISIGDKIWNGTSFNKVIAKKESSAKLKKITLLNGTEIYGTDEHIFPLISENGPTEKKLKYLNIGDTLLLNSKELNNEENVDFLDFDFTPSFGGFGEKFRFTDYCKIPHILTDDLSELLGILIGDGSLGHTYTKAFDIAIGWPDAENNYDNYIISLINKVFEKDCQYSKTESLVEKGKYNGVIKVFSVEIKEFLDYIGLKKHWTSKNKRVPSCIWNSTLSNRLSFLRGVFDTDGCVDKNSISISCLNEDLGKDLHLLFNSVGIRTSIRRVKNNDSMISIINIISEDKVNFAKLIGSSILRKKEKIDKFKISKYSTDRLNLVPIYFNKKYNIYPSSSSSSDYIGKSTFLRKSPNLDESDRWLFDNFDFGQIISIENIKEEDTVIDISVEGENKYFIANGILTHNSSPSIAYLMENNNLVTQALVMAHCYGHNAFFKNNFLFKEWTQPKSIVEYCVFARDYISRCEQKYGYEKVEELLDACHMLEHHGVDKYKRSEPLSPKAEIELQEKRIADEQKFIYEFWNTLPIKEENQEEEHIEKIFPKEPQENILRFIEKHSPNLKPWQREIVRIVRYFAQYFYPQSQSKIGNEGFATFTHYNILYKMFDLGYLTDGFMQNFVELHTGVVAQYQYNNINPYYLGYNIYNDIKRICTEPTKEDEEWFPYLIGQDWKKEIQNAAYNFKDESFITQYLSPNIIRKMRLFNVHDDSQLPEYHITDISNDDGYKKIRKLLSKMYNRAYQIPDVQITKANIKTDRKLTLTYFPVNDIPLEMNDLEFVEDSLDYLWGFPTKIIEAS